MQSVHTRTKSSQNCYFFHGFCSESSVGAEEFMLSGDLESGLALLFHLIVFGDNERIASCSLQMSIGLSEVSRSDWCWSIRFFLFYRNLDGFILQHSPWIRHLQILRNKVQTLFMQCLSYSLSSSQLHCYASRQIPSQTYHPLTFSRWAQFTLKWIDLILTLDWVIHKIALALSS